MERLRGMVCLYHQSVPGHEYTCVYSDLSLALRRAEKFVMGDAEGCRKGMREGVHTFQGIANEERKATVAIIPWLDEVE